MMIKNIESKIKLSFFVAIISIVASILIAGFAITYSYGMISKERDKIYVLDNGVPLLVTRTDAIELQLIRSIIYFLHYLQMMIIYSKI